MATPISATDLIKALKAEGVNVKESPGWKTHNRNGNGRKWGPVYGVVIHHTAGTNSLNLCIKGTSSLPGPLCHAHLAKTGVVTTVGHGRTNHAGAFARNAFDAMANQHSTHPRPDATDAVDANSHTYGIEVENRGDGKDPYPAEQYDQAVRWATALCRFHGWTEHAVIGHGEGTRRKIDPSFDMNRFRADVAKRLASRADDKPAAGTYTVKQGDTLSAIGQRLGVAWADIASANKIAKPYRIFPGDVLTIPTGGKSAPKPSTPSTPAKPRVSLSALVKAARTDPPRSGAPVSYAGVRTVEDALRREGLLSARYVDGHYGTLTVSAYAAWQRSLGYRGRDADGIPGSASLRQLGAKYGFEVTG